jgi:hypothetical protein
MVGADLFCGGDGRKGRREANANNKTIKAMRGAISTLLPQSVPCG